MGGMNALTNALKNEVARLARKEIKAETDALRKAVTSHRSEIASLKRDLKAATTQLRRQAKLLDALAPSKAESPTPKGVPGRERSLDPKSFAALRAKWGITQAQMAQLLGASSLSVYKWESGKATPRAAQLERIHAVRKLGKRAVAARLAGVEANKA